MAAELTSIADELANAINDAQKFDKGNDTAGTRVRKAAQEAKSRLQGLRNMVT
ncbi:histone H1, partial [Citrobacter sp. AAK_AS5]